MKKLFRPYLTFLLLGSLIVTATSCGDDDGPEPPATEEIASARLTLVPEGKGALVVVNYSENQQQGATLLSSTTHNGELELFDAEGNDITSDISQNANIHEVFYEPSSGLGITVEKTDTDGNGRPVGLETTLTTTNAGTGTMRVRLKHQPDKGNTSDVNKGATDLDMTFNVVVQ